MKKILLLSLVLFSGAIFSQIKLDDAISKTKKKVKGGGKLSNDEVVQGLKEALNVGTNNSTSVASKLDGFYKNPAIKIPFPEEAIKIKNFAEKFGMQEQSDKFVETLNRGAEEASKEAAPIFLAAIKDMSIGDGFAILNGEKNAATKYLTDKTTEQLKVKFAPIVKAALEKVQVTKYWNPIINKYNMFPGVQKLNPDLDAYVTERALQGLFKLVADEELKIRQDPAARVSDLLKKVFAKK